MQVFPATREAVPTGEMLKVRSSTPESAICQPPKCGGEAFSGWPICTASRLLGQLDDAEQASTANRPIPSPRFNYLGSGPKFEDMGSSRLQPLSLTDAERRARRSLPAQALATRAPIVFASDETDLWRAGPPALGGSVRPARFGRADVAVNTAAGAGARPDGDLSFQLGPTESAGGNNDAWFRA